MKQNSAGTRTEDAAARWRRFAISAVLILLLSGLIPAARAGEGMTGGTADTAPPVTDAAD